MPHSSRPHTAPTTLARTLLAALGILRALVALAALGTAASTAAAESAASSTSAVSAAETGAPWTLVRDRAGIRVQTRPVAGSGIREFQGTALVPASAAAIRTFLRDADQFKTWFPNTSESRLLSRTGDVSYQYSVLDTPWPVADRDNVFRAETTVDATTGTITIAIRADPDRHPEQPGRVRVRKARGEWRLEPVSARETRVRFTMHLEPGGGVPEWLINAQVVETPFEALTNLRARLTGLETR